ncbi:type I methionyl aminopeptidase [candidate division WWE3 bacterium RBG_19FT_COMBO_34_6]|uniref:Methionine aminopeptidase n=1 Tax=candidate division WWE3 bacterium RBG_19FT_COMBO_34_6 TaxID=1802612 RepID=A0A1F4UL17_UNCKA|nr:MAG: type I methionyl aminopeptidase [candidate division WWE3 bacterium RBG_19FT_COMBO_34_6]
MSNIPIKTTIEIEIMRRNGQKLAKFMEILKNMIRPGLDVWVLEQKFIDLCLENKVIPACKGYAPGGLAPFPTGLCLSINDQSVHCYPVKGTILKDGDIVNIDTVIMDLGLHVDSAFACGVGSISKENRSLLKASEDALYTAIDKIRSGIKIGLLSETMEMSVKKCGYNVLQEYAGHGIGRQMHEIPEIPCFGNSNFGPIIKDGMVLAVESLVCEKNSRLVHNSVWVTKTADGGNFVQFEHTVLVTKNGYEILTKI